MEPSFHSRRPSPKAVSVVNHASLYARLAQTSEWDVTAGHAILAAAGGIVTMPGGSELTPDFPCPRLYSPG